jgi:ferric-dicitrate binding protein FerR (iron transport regulator)
MVRCSRRRAYETQMG